MFGFSAMGLRLAVAAFALLAAFIGGYKVSSNACKAAQADALKAAEAARRVDESFSQGVSTAYEQVASQLRRITTTNRVELTREVQKVEYRCPLPADALRMLNDSIAAANTAASQSNGPLPADSRTDGERPRGAGDSLFGTDGDIR